MAGIRTTTVTNCFIRLAAREPFHSQLAPQDRHSSWLYALFFSTSCSSPFYFVFFFQHAVEDNVTRGWMNGWTAMRAAGGRCFFEIEPINPGPIPWTYTARSLTYRSNTVEKLMRSLLFMPPIAIFIINLDLSVEANYLKLKSFSVKRSCALLTFFKYVWKNNSIKVYIFYIKLKIIIFCFI